MKYMQTVQVPATEKQVVDKVTCDLCGAQIKRKGFSAEEVEVKHRTGLIYPEGGGGYDAIFDICGQCFEGKLVPWLGSQGAEPRTERWDY